MRNYIKSVVALTVITAVVAVMLAMTNYITEPIIAENQAAAANAAVATAPATRLPVLSFPR